jgi:hypothetical protein
MTEFAIILLVVVFVGGVGIGLGLVLAPRIGRLANIGDDERDEHDERPDG